MRYNRFVDKAKLVIGQDKQLQIFLKKGKDGLLQRYPVGIKPKEYPNSEWQVDSTKIDFMVKIKDPTAKKGYRLGRKNLSAVIDCASGAAYAQLIDRTNSTQQLRVLFNAFGKMGVPDKVRSDNGSDYASKHYQGFLKLCKISSVRCAPYEGRQKGKIERFFGVLHSALEWLPGYLGCDVAQRQRLEAQRASKKDTLSGAKTHYPEDQLLYEEELQTLIDHELEQRYNNYKGHAPYLASAQELSKIYSYLGKTHTRTVRAYGVELDNVVFTSAQMWEKCAIGQSVLVVENPDDPQEVSLYTPTKREFIATAHSTTLGPRALDLKGFKKAKADYLKNHLNPFLKRVQSAQDNVATHRATKIKGILSNYQKPPRAQSQPPSNKINTP
ncbi:DDE-type integrase/transposase/recombinase [Helicobacter vulpis]|uniref:DDE-type integrase/transposase/recombinase n=1 Tax=Helicobacter vulpis TaxID=2316076 RepID=UPI000EB26E78|nr:DDE-type integrase/transposase/recombinase [Helicobacter vulpis]